MSFVTVLIKCYCYKANWNSLSWCVNWNVFKTAQVEKESVKVNQTRMRVAEPNNTDLDTMQLQPVPLATHHQLAPWSQ